MGRGKRHPFGHLLRAVLGAAIIVIASAAQAVAVDCSLDQSSIIRWRLDVLPVPNPTQVSPTETITGSVTCSVHLTINGPVTLPDNLTAEALDALIRLGILQFTGSTTDTTMQTTFGPATILVGFDQSETMFVAAGTTNTNTHVHTAYFVSVVVPANAGASNASLGDLHTAFHNVLLDDGFSFIDQLLSHGSGASSVMFSPEPMAFFGGGLSSPALDQTAAFAGGRSHADADIDAWFAVLPRASRYDGTATNFGFTSGGVAITGGIDKTDGPWRYGVGLSLDATGVVQDTTADSGRIVTARIGAYGSYDFGDIDLTGAIALGLHRIETTRLSALPVPSTASYGAASFGAGLEARGHYEADPFLLEPMAGIVYTAVASEAFTETGPLGIAGAADTTQALKVYAGGDASMELVSGNGWTWTPSLRGRVLYDLLDDPRAFTASFVADPAATPFIVTGINPSRLAAMVRAAIDVDTGNGLTVEASYDLTLRNGAIAHQASAGARGSF